MPNCQTFRVHAEFSARMNFYVRIWARLPPLTRPRFQRKIAFVPATFSEAFARVRRRLVADFQRLAIRQHLTTAPNDGRL
jgi:hypothetical protein